MRTSSLRGTPPALRSRPSPPANFNTIGEHIYLMFLKIFKRRSKISPVSKQAGSVVTTQPAVARRRSEASHRMLIDIGRKLKNVEAAVADHDGYVREHVVTRLSIRELIEALQKQLQVIPSAKSVDLNDMKNTTENHKKVLAFLAHDPSTTYTYQELADMTHQKDRADPSRMPSSNTGSHLKSSSSSPAPSRLRVIPNVFCGRRKRR